MSGELEGKRALVTGASRGIGKAIATEFVRQGAEVVLASRKQEALDAVAEELNSLGVGRAHPRACHIGDPEAVTALLDWADASIGRIEVLVNNAATNPHFGPMFSVDGGAWQKTFDVNVRGTFELTRRVVERLLEHSESGSVINVTSILGVNASPLMGVYGMTKAAIISMTKTLAIELGTRGIRVNAIAPGLVETRFAQALLGNEEVSRTFIQRTALRRHGQVDDLTGPAVFLASDASRYVTGHVLNVDGGYLVS
ncbi:MAG: glucose 1-dehydrogenase [Myxococcota bacterium]